MDKNDRKILVNRILKKMPPTVKHVEYLVDILEISKESVYRRIRGDIPFNFDEIIKLSLDLGFSVDEIFMGNASSYAIFGVRSGIFSKPEEVFHIVLEDYYNLMTQETRSANGKAIISMNRLFPFLVTKFTHLFKFSYYRWLHQGYDVPLNFYLSDVTIPDNILSSCQKINNIQGVDNTTFILDQGVFLNTLRYVNYYYKRGLISVHEMDLLKKDILSVIDEAEWLMKSDVNDLKNIYDFYLSSVDIESNTIYVECEGVLSSYFWIHFQSPIVTSNLTVCNAHKRWLDSLKKYSSLITRSNELLQADFFEKQRTYLKSIPDISA